MSADTAIRISHARRFIASLGLCVLAPVMACASPVPAATHLDRPAPQQLDSILFAAVVTELMNEMSGTVKLESPRVDPRPIAGRADVLDVRFAYLPDSAQLRRSVFVDGDTSVLRVRRDILALAGATEGDVFSHITCPGGLRPHEEPHITELRENCPQVAFGVAIIALPRPNGAWAPAAVDERAKYHGRDVYSVRVIETTLDPRGRWEAVTDFVFERVEGSRFALLERRVLFASP